MRGRAVRFEALARWRRWLACLALACLGGCAATVPSRGGASPGFAAALERALPYAVGVYVVTPPGGGDGAADDAARLPTIGAGFMLDDLGHVVTASHVVADGGQIVVKLADQRVVAARRVADDPETDIALLALPADATRTPPFGRTAALRPGDWVLAVGEPYGLNRSVAAGVVGGKDRHFPDDAETLFIQSDLALNPGNSGGPLVDTAGDIVGMNLRTVIGPYGTAGVSLSVPIELVLQIAAELREHGAVRRPRLGAEFEDLPPVMALARGRPYASGAWVSLVHRGSLAERVGLRGDDIVVAMNGRAIGHSADFARALLGWRQASGTSFVVFRGGTFRTLILH